MTDLVAAAGPPTFATSACFFVATPDNDEQLRRAHAWAAAIVARVADPKLAQHRSLVSLRALMLHIDRESAVVAGNPLTVDAPAALGGIKEHTIVLMTRALDPVSKTQGVLLSGREWATDAVMIDEDALGALSRVCAGPEYTRAQVKVTSIAPHRAAKDVAAVLNMLGRSVYRSIYLCTIGEGRAVDRLAARIFALTGIPAYYNTAPLVLDGAPSGALLTPPRVGPVGGATVDGHAHYSTAGVALVAADMRSFLPGAQVMTQAPTS